MPSLNKASTGWAPLGGPPTASSNASDENPAAGRNASAGGSPGAMKSAASPLFGLIAVGLLASPVAIQLPPRVTLEVTETEPAMKGQTASSSYKPARLANGARVMVPPHITVGTRIIIQTADGSYIERAKD